MKEKLFLLCLGAALVACQSTSNHANHQQQANNEQVVSDTAKGSPKRMAMANIGKAHVHIEYHSPAVRKRVIWGGLVAYGNVWVTGAHKATSISFSDDVTIAGKNIEKGKYALFTIPNEKEWTVIINKNWDQHLADEYSEKDDILRLKAVPQANTLTERLTYQVIATDKKSGKVEISWDKIKISFDVAQK